MSDSDSNGDSILKLTDAALAKVLQLRSDETEPELLALWVEVDGVKAGAYLRHVLPGHQ